MRITVIAFGTRGDVQPAIVLGKALNACDHQVRILAGRNFTGWIEKHGLEAAVSSVDIEAVMDSEGGQAWVENGNNPIVQMRLMKKLLDRHGLDMVMDAWKASHDAQAIVSSFTSDTYAVSIAEKLQIKHISMPLQPVPPNNFI